MGKGMAQDNSAATYYKNEYKKLEIETKDGRAKLIAVCFGVRKVLCSIRFPKRTISRR